MKRVGQYDTDTASLYLVFPWIFFCFCTIKGVLEFLDVCQAIQTSGAAQSVDERTLVSTCLFLASGGGNGANICSPNFLSDCVYESRAR